MNALTQKLLIIFGLTLTMSAMAHAQATRTWVSGVGDDANPCSRTAPCKTFAGAISKTAAGGEISVLDPGGFGALTITKSITIDGEGPVSSVLVSGTNGINVSAATTDVVILRHLELQGIHGSGLTGIQYNSAARLVVDDCNILGFATDGIATALSGAGSNGNLLVKDTTIDGGADCVLVNATSSGTINASLTDVTLSGCTNGLEAAAGYANISNSDVTMNSNDGILADGTGRILAESNMVSTNGAAGVDAETGAIMSISNDDLFNNGAAIGAGAGSVATASNNRKLLNHTAPAGTTTTTITTL